MSGILYDRQSSTIQTVHFVIHHSHRIVTRQYRKGTGLCPSTSKRQPSAGMGQGTRYIAEQLYCTSSSRLQSSDVAFESFPISDLWRSGQSTEQRFRFIGNYVDSYTVYDAFLW